MFPTISPSAFVPSLPSERDAPTHTQFRPLVSNETVSAPKSAATDATRRSKLFPGGAPKSLTPDNFALKNQKALLIAHDMEPDDAEAIVAILVELNKIHEGKAEKFPPLPGKNDHVCRAVQHRRETTREVEDPVRPFPGRGHRVEFRHAAKPR
ncbi:MAG: hypothetical protein ACRYGK_15205 [Janthinobacterium lividum]